MLAFLVGLQRPFIGDTLSLQSSSLINFSCLSSCRLPLSFYLSPVYLCVVYSCICLLLVYEGLTLLYPLATAESYQWLIHVFFSNTFGHLSIDCFLLGVMVCIFATTLWSLIYVYSLRFRTGLIYSNLFLLFIL